MTMAAATPASATGANIMKFQRFAQTAGRTGRAELSVDGRQK